MRLQMSLSYIKLSAASMSSQSKTIFNNLAKIHFIFCHAKYTRFWTRFAYFWHLFTSFNLSKDLSFCVLQLFIFCSLTLGLCGAMLLLPLPSLIVRVCGIAASFYESSESNTELKAFWTLLLKRALHRVTDVNFSLWQPQTRVHTLMFSTVSTQSLLQLERLQQEKCTLVYENMNSSCQFCFVTKIIGLTEYWLKIIQSNFG